jgi:5-bromo-4-chloroindolyl phosphate hydrolysis protein
MKMTRAQFQQLHELTDEEIEWLSKALKDPDVKIKRIVKTK